MDRSAFERHVAAGGFLEWAEVLDHLYGTPVPDPPPGHDVLLEIDVQGARQVRAASPGAVVILLLAPSIDVQADRLRSRGDPEEHVQRRIALGRLEEREAREMTDHVVVNGDLESAVAEVSAIIEAARSAAGRS